MGGASCAEREQDGVPVIRLQNNLLSVDVAPSVGGRITALRHLPSGYEYLWRNASLPLRRALPGAEYDEEFYGGIDEQIPCDVAERIDGADFPDHGELWTRVLDAVMDGERLTLMGHLPLLGFQYERTMELAQDAAALHMRYRVVNHSGRPRAFLWKLHAALAVCQGDRIVCPAARARPLSLEWSRRGSTDFFPWPCVDGIDMSEVPAVDGSAEFLALTGLADGRIGWRRPSTGRELRISFDTAVFPCCWVFASYGKLRGHYTVVLEPATSPALTREEDRAGGAGFLLQPGASLVTAVTVTVG